MQRFYYGSKWNYMYACTINLYDIQKVRNAFRKLGVLRRGENHKQSRRIGLN